MNKKDNTLFYVLAVILVFVLISYMKDKNSNKNKTTSSTTTEKEPDLTDPTTGEGIYLPDDYDPTKDAPIVVNPGGIMATVPDSNTGNAVDVIKEGSVMINNAVVQGYTV